MKMDKSEGWRCYIIFYSWFLKHKFKTKIYALRPKPPPLNRFFFKFSKTTVSGPKLYVDSEY